MLNKNGERELAYVVRIDAVEPIHGSDNCEAAIVGGWRVMVRKNTFVPGNLAVYFEIDSRLPEREEFAFMAGKHYKVKSQRYTFGGKGLMVSQGLLMSPQDFKWHTDSSGRQFVVDCDDDKHWADDDSRFLTAKLGVVYAEADDNKRKVSSVDKYKKMAQRNAKIFRQPWARWMMQRKLGKKVMFLLFGNKRDKVTPWPAWVSKTDEERVQNMPWILNDKSKWIATEKIDGTSTTFTLRKGKKRLFGRAKDEFLVCSRNVVFHTPNQKCFYPTNVYTEMAVKYDAENVLRKILKALPQAEWVTLQGETYGAGIQKRDYSQVDHCFAGFNLITSDMGRWNSLEAKRFLEPFGIPWVPIIDEGVTLPDTVDELLAYATGNSAVDGRMREGIVFRSEDGRKSFKAVSNEYLLKFHA